MTTRRPTMSDAYRAYRTAPEGAADTLPRYAVGDRVREEVRALRMRLGAVIPREVRAATGVVTSAIECVSAQGVPTQRITVAWPQGREGVCWTLGDGGARYWSPADLVRAR